MSTKETTMIQVGDSVRIRYEGELGVGVVVKITGDIASIRIDGYALCEKRDVALLIKAGK